MIGKTSQTVEAERQREAEAFNKWHNDHVKMCGRKLATEAYRSAVEQGHSEEYAKTLAEDTYNNYLSRNLE